MDKDYLKQIKNYLIYTGRLSNTFGPYCKFYNMTTENIYGFLKNYDLNGKSILTVAGSGDQRLNAYLLGARNVTVFDSNPLTLLNMRLKDAAIKNLKFSDFKGFYGIEEDKLNEYAQLDVRLFNKIKDDLDEFTFDFFQFIISNDELLDVDDVYFNFQNDYKVLKKANYYFNAKRYIELRKKIKNKGINFMYCDVTELPDTLEDRKFDMILLSNISDYIHCIYDINYLEHFRYLIDKLKNNLNPDGIIQVGYIYSHHGKKDGISDFYRDEIRKEVFTDEQFDTVLVDSFDNPNNRDKVIVYMNK